LLVVVRGAMEHRNNQMDHFLVPAYILMERYVRVKIAAQRSLQ
jgi:hypothetical protein